MSPALDQILLWQGRIGQQMIASSHRYKERTAASYFYPQYKRYDHMQIINYYDVQNRREGYILGRLEAQYESR
jgi:hypothetical protein